jgi:transcriptional regulator
MYVPPHYADSAPSETFRTLVADFPLGILCTHGPSGFAANHVPFQLHQGDGEFAEFGLLRTHVARANPVWQHVSDGDAVLVIFQGPDGYVSPNWYPSTSETPRHVPTWNYVVAHAHGRITVHDDERYVRAVVGQLTREREATEAHPWRMADTPQAVITTMLKAIVGLEVRVERVVTKLKLGQNKHVEDIRGAARTLQNRGHGALADAMLTGTIVRTRER